jgi:Tfp pilus assembly protein PilF
MSDRVEQLKQFIAEDPADPFNYYALALEYVKIDESKALAILNELVQSHKDYVPIYYQLAKLYERVGQKENAIHTFYSGIKVAQQQQDLKTLHELNAALQELLED